MSQMKIYEVQLARPVTEYRIVRVLAPTEKLAKIRARQMVRGDVEPIQPNEHDGGEWCDGSEGRVTVKTVEVK